MQQHKDSSINDLFKKIGICEGKFDDEYDLTIRLVTEAGVIEELLAAATRFALFHFIKKGCHYQIFDILGFASSESGIEGTGVG